MSRVREIALDAPSVIAAGLGYALGAVLLILMFAGGVYRTECTLPNGVHTEGWELGDSLPYLWSPGEGCEAHTLTRIALGELGIMSKVS
jgi:hypothetical protein